jgi:hypothetical protein
MKRSPFQLRLWWLLSLVVVAALDCAAFRSPLSGRRLTLIMILLGVLPMANLLFLALLVSLQRGGVGVLPSGSASSSRGCWSS